MGMTRISAAEAKEKLAAGARLVDIRPMDEFQREHIAQASCVSLQTLEHNGLDNAEQRDVIFYCRSGNRTQMSAAVLEKSCPDVAAYMLDGGLDSWKQAGLPISVDKTQPLALSQQVQLAAASLILLGVLLTVLVSPWFIVIPAFVGCGLLLAGMTGFCGMARLLMKMPWNRRALDKLA